MNVSMVVFSMHHLQVLMTLMTRLLGLNLLSTSVRYCEKVLAQYYSLAATQTLSQQLLWSYFVRLMSLNQKKRSGNSRNKCIILLLLSRKQIIISIRILSQCNTKTSCKHSSILPPDTMSMIFLS